MILKKTIRAKIFGLTAKKEALLLEEYNNWQARLRGDKEKPLIAATKQQADRLLISLGKNYKKEKEYPLTIRNDSYNIQRARETKWADWWFRVPVAGLYGGVWCPIAMAHNQEYLLDGCVLRESKLIRKENQWFVHIVVQTEVPDPIVSCPHDIIAVDLGEVRPATAVLLRDGHYQGHIFASKKVREIRMHYSWLRQQLGRCKCFDSIKKIGSAEHRKVDAELHKLSKEIVKFAKENNAIIVLGDLKGIRNGAKRKGKNFASKINRMPSYRMAKFIEYKAQWIGVPVFYIDESYTSKICHVCGSLGSRPHQALFICPNCGSQYNADLNGAINIGRRFLDQVLGNSAAYDTALNFGDVMPLG